MVATRGEAEAIVGLLLKSFPIDATMKMMKEVWYLIGSNTDNESLRDTIILINDILEEKWEYLLQNHGDTLSQVPES
tara:strand:- start:1656 stop:1886 length:231 start_codon:yes stop_codon:yes gene_type:complete